MISILQKEYGVKEIKNRLYSHSAAYACVFVIFLFKGMLAEIQIIGSNDHNDEVGQVRKIVCHTLYEVIRGNSGPTRTLEMIIGSVKARDIRIRFHTQVIIFAKKNASITVLDEEIVSEIVQQ